MGTDGLILQIDTTNKLMFHFHFPPALASLRKIKLGVLNSFDLHLPITSIFFHVTSKSCLACNISSEMFAHVALTDCWMF